MLDSLKYAIMKENEIPRLIEIIFNKLSSSNNYGEMEVFNKHMRSAKEILKDFEL